MSERLTETFLENYFKNVATVSKDILHTDESPAFYRICDPYDLDEWDTAVRSMAKDVALLLELNEGNMGEFDSQRDMPKIGLHCIIKTTEAFADINAARDQAKQILQKIVARMRFDCQMGVERPDQQNGPLKALTILFDSKIKWQNMSAVDGNWYGKSFWFIFSAPMNLAYNPNDFTA